MLVGHVLFHVTGHLAAVKRAQGRIALVAQPAQPVQDVRPIEEPGRNVRLDPGLGRLGERVDAPAQRLRDLRRPRACVVQVSRSQVAHLVGQNELQRAPRPRSPEDGRQRAIHAAGVLGPDVHSGGCPPVARPRVRGGPSRGQPGDRPFAPGGHRWTGDWRLHMAFAAERGGRLWRTRWPCPGAPAVIRPPSDEYHAHDNSVTPLCRRRWMMVIISGPRGQRRVPKNHDLREDSRPVRIGLQSGACSSAAGGSAWALIGGHAGPTGHPQ
jgi:hypothetical protein